MNSDPLSQHISKGFSLHSNSWFIQITRIPLQLLTLCALTFKMSVSASTPDAKQGADALTVLTPLNWRKTLKHQERINDISLVPLLHLNTLILLPEPDLRIQVHSTLPSSSQYLYQEQIHFQKVIASQHQMNQLYQMYNSF